MTSNSDSKKSPKTGCITLFSLPFIAAGIFSFYTIVTTVYAWYEVQSWEETPVRILEVELIKKRNGDGSAYDVTARYEYTYHGNEFSGETVDCYKGSDNIGTYHQDVHAELLSHKNSGQLFRCYVNPGDPSKAVLYRTFRFELIGFTLVFVLLFGGVGIYLITAAQIGKKRLQEEWERRQQYPDEPWHWEKGPPFNRFTCTTKQKLYKAAFFALFWNVMSAPIWFLVIPTLWEEEEKFKLLVLLFPIVGIGLAVWAARCFIRLKKYGESVFEMTSLPGVIGGPIGGVIYTQVKLRPEDGFRVSLNCIRKTIVNTGKGTSTQERTIWQDTRIISKEIQANDQTRSVIPVLFGIPYDSLETNRENPRKQILWRIQIEAATPGVDYATEFEVPVYKTAQSSPDFVLDEAPIAEFEFEPEPETVLDDIGVRIESLVAGGRRYVFPMARHKLQAFILTLFVPALSTILYYLFKAESSFVIYIFRIVISIFDWVLIYGMFDLWFGKSVIETRSSRLASQSGIFGIGRRREFELEDIQSIKPVAASQMGKQLLYRLGVKTKDGRTYKIGRSLPSLQHAEFLIAEIEKDLLT